MSRIYLLIVLGVSIYIFLHSRWTKFLHVFWHRVNPASRKKLTMFDVRHCILAGEKEMAIQIYAELFQSSYEESRAAVDQLEKSIQEKNELE